MGDGSAENGSERIMHDSSVANGPGLQTAPEPEVAAQILAALGHLQESFDAKIRYDEVREHQVTALHEELETHRRGLYQQILQPVLMDLIGIHDEMVKVASDTALQDTNSPGVITAGMTFLLESVEEILLRNGVTSFTCEGDNVDRSRQKVIQVVPTSRMDLDRRVARRVRLGFELAGKVLRPEWIVAYRYAPGTGEPGADRESGA